MLLPIRFLILKRFKPFLADLMKNGDLGMILGISSKNGLVSGFRIDFLELSPSGVVLLSKNKKFLIFSQVKKHVLYHWKSNLKKPNLSSQKRAFVLFILA